MSTDEVSAIAVVDDQLAEPTAAETEGTATITTPSIVDSGAAATTGIESAPQPPAAAAAAETGSSRSSTSGGGNGNGKREREERVRTRSNNNDDEEEGEEGEEEEEEATTATKQLKSSDDSDNTTGGGGLLSGRSSVSIDDHHPTTTTTNTTTAATTTTSTTESTTTLEAAPADIVILETTMVTAPETESIPTSTSLVENPLVASEVTTPSTMIPTNVAQETATRVEGIVADMIAAAPNSLADTDVGATTTTTTTSAIAADPRVAVTTTTSAAAATTAVGSSSTGGGVDPNAVATISNPEQMVEETGVVSAQYVGRVIGKGGEMIRDLQARSGARIDVDQNVPIGQPRVITYRGTRETVDFAKHLVQMLSTDGMSDTDLPLGNAAQEYVIIPAQSVGKVIGRGGEMIRELQSRSQAKIQIDHTGQSGIPADQKQVTITGTYEAVLKGKEMVLLLVANPLMDAQLALNMLIDDKIRGGGQWGSGPPYMNLPNQGVNMQPHMAPQSQYPGGGGMAPQQPGYGMYGQAPMGGGAAPSMQQHGNPMMAASGYPQQQPHASMPFGGPPMGAGGYQQSQPMYMSDGRESELLYVSKQFMGRIIGSKGVTINDLQRRSQCDIQINQDVPPGKDCEITVKGTRPGIDMAKSMIQEIIEVGPHHPYAGGVENYGTKNVGGGYHGGSFAPPQQQQQQPHQQQQHHQSQYNPYQQPQPSYDQGGAYGQAAYPQQGNPGYTAPMMGGSSYGQPMQQPYHQQQTPVYGGVGGGYPPVQQPQQTTAIPRHQPPAPQPVAAAASFWKAAPSPDGQIYYYDERTGATQWEKPPGMP